VASAVAHGGADSAPAAHPVRGVLIRVGLILLSALLLVLANPKASLWPLALVGGVPMFFAVRDRGPLAAFGWAWLLGFVGNFAWQWWGIQLLQRFGKLEWWTAALVVAAVAAYQGVVFGICAAGGRLLATRTRIPVPFAAAAAMVVGEFAIPFIMPWNSGMLLAPFWPATQVADLFGTLSVTFVLVLCNGGVYVALEALLARQPLPRRTLLAVAGVLVATLGYGLVRGYQIDRVAARAPKVRVGLVQPNFGIASRKLRADRWPEMVDTLRKVSQRAEREGAQLVVWPESAWPLPVDRSLKNDYAEDHPWQLRRGLTVPLLAGVLTRDYSKRQVVMHNSAWLLDRDGRGRGRYDKVFLMPFGEYVPLGDRYPEWRRSVRERMTESDEFARGVGPEVLTLDNLRLAPMICYEDILGAHVREFAALKPNLLVTLSNLAWFGDSAEPPQQLLLATLRAIELRHEFLRATSTGVSAHIDAVGRVRARTTVVDPPPNVLRTAPELLVVDAALVDQGRTLFAIIGDAFAWACVAFLLAAIAGAWLRRPRWLVPPP
jgi:apolipoprotein N-acyltransferase